MRLTILRDILFIFTEIIEDFGIWTTRITNWGSFYATATAPPVFMVVIKENVFTVKNSTLCSIFCATNFGNFGIDTGLFENLLPNFSCFRVFWNTIFFTTNKASDINFMWVKSNHFSQKFEEGRNLLLLEIVAKRPVTKHFKNRGVSWVANIFDILQTQAWLGIRKSFASWMWLAKKKW